MYQSSYPYNQQFQTFPQQQIPTVNGRSSLDTLRLAPNSSVLIADSISPLIYRCVSDSLGNVSTQTYDITLHKDEEQVKKEQTELILADLVSRIERLEQNESNFKRSEPTNAEHGTNKADDEYGKERKQSAGNGKPTNPKQS